MQVEKIKEYVLIVAGGSGSRMKSDIPKQFLKIGDWPILMHSIQKFFQYSAQIHCILALPEKEFPTWEKLIVEYQFSFPVQLSKGGGTRFESVKNALALIEDETGLVAVHDAVRPFVSIETIIQCFETARNHGTAVAVVPLKDSVREMKGEESIALDRTKYCLVQTPQTFRAGLLKEAYQVEYDLTLTDDASVVEKLGAKINLVQGTYENIKITSPEDLIIAEALISSKSKQAN